MHYDFFSNVVNKKSSKYYSQYKKLMKIFIQFQFGNFHRAPQSDFSALKPASLPSSVREEVSSGCPEAEGIPVL